MGLKERMKRNKAVSIFCGVLVVLLVLFLIGYLSHRKEGTGGYLGEGGRSKLGTTEGNAPFIPAEGVQKSSESQEGKTVSNDLYAQLPDVTKTIKSGSLEIEIKKGEYEQAYGRISSIANSCGGYISDSHSESSKGRLSGGTITIRVPAQKFFSAMEQLKELGKVTSISENAQDVTEEYVDLESRLRNLRAQESVYISLMAKAKTIEESVTIQRELANLQGQIEQILGRKNYLDNRIEFSTIQVNLVEHGMHVTPTEGWGFVQALRDALHGIVNGVNEVVRFAGYAFPYAVIIFGLCALIWYLVKRSKKSERESEAPLS